MMSENTTLQLLTENIVMLSKIQDNSLGSLVSEIHDLKKTNEELKRDNDDLNFIISTTILQSSKKRSCCDSETEETSKTVKILNPVKRYKTTKQSYSEEEITKVFNNLKNINDIIKLESLWKQIRHDSKLQKLYNIIPSLIKLNNMIGLTKIKEQIFKVIIYYVQNEYTDEYLHTVINGPPGVGKTEFAKIYGEIFLALNILKNNTFISVKKDNLIAKYVGQTSHQTKKVLESAMGGVLFLDEAYSLAHSDGRDSFAKEAIDMINIYLSEKKDQFMFIIAGYEDDLEDCFFSMNKGLKRRFSHTFNIDKYSSNELRQIFELKIKQSNYELDVSIEKLDIWFNKNIKIFKYFGGDIERLCNYIKYEQSLRTFNNGTVDRKVTLDDIEKCLVFFKNPKEYQGPPLGMYC